MRGPVFLPLDKRARREALREIMKRPLQHHGWVEPDSEPALNDLIRFEEWQAAADSLEVGDTIPREVMPAEAAVFVAAYAAERGLIIEPDETRTFWHVTSDKRGAA